jgi:hypothetical protein
MLVGTIGLWSGVFATALCIGGDDPKSPSGLPLLTALELSSERAKDWAYTDPAAWTVKMQDGKALLELAKQSKYEPKVRSPLNIALAPGLDVSDVDMTLEVRSTGRDYGHRDLCFFFGHQDASHFYYVHLAKEADPHANSIFLVNGEPRVSIAEQRTKGTPWTDKWHKVRIVRLVSDGSIEVYFDDMKTPIMVAHDKTFAHGRIGVGSFDDTGQFRDIVVWGRKVDETKK